jgi:hypothetical protein
MDLTNQLDKGRGEVTYTGDKAKKKKIQNDSREQYSRWKKCNFVREERAKV